MLSFHLIINHRRLTVVQLFITFYCLLLILYVLIDMRLRKPEGCISAMLS